MAGGPACSTTTVEDTARFARAPAPDPGVGEGDPYAGRRVGRCPTREGQERTAVRLWIADVVQEDARDLGLAAAPRSAGGPTAASATSAHAASVRRHATCRCVTRLLDLDADAHGLGRLEERSEAVVALQVPSRKGITQRSTATCASSCVSVTGGLQSGLGKHPSE